MLKHGQPNFFRIVKTIHLSSAVSTMQSSSNLMLEFWLILVALLFVTCLPHSRAASLELSGILETKSYKPSGDLNFSSSERFVIVTDGTYYRIRFAKSEIDSAKNYVEVAFDGTNTYYLNSMLGWFESQRSKGAKIADNVATAVITKTPVPKFPYAEQASVLWCAFVATSYLNGIPQKTSVFIPFSSGINNGATAQPNDFLMFPAVWTYHSPGTDYLEELTYINEGLNTAESLRLGLSDGFTNCIYRTLEWTVLSGKVIPSSGMARTFALREKGISRVFEFAFQLKNKALHHEPKTYTPAIPGITAVTDERFNDSARKDFRFMYRVVSNWYSLTEAKKTKAYKAAAATITSRPIDKRPSHLAEVVFVLLTIAPIVIFFRYREKKAK